MQTCDLCGLEIRGRAVAGEIGRKRAAFCCAGCRQVYHMLMEASDSPDPARFRETEIYRRCVEAGIIPAPGKDLENRVPEGDTGIPATGPRAGDAARDGRAPVAEDRRLTLDLKLQGMWCPACAWVIEEALRKQPGVIEARCGFVTDRAQVVYDPVKSAPRRIVQVVEKLGYAAAPAGSQDRGAAAGTYLRLGISAFLTVNVMMLSFALYSGFFTALSAESAARISWPILVMAAVVFFYGGAPIHRKAVSGVRAGAPGMEALVSLGAGSAFFYSLYHFYHHSIHLYFDTAAMLITLVLAGKAAEQWVRDKIQARISGVIDLLPQKVRLCTDTRPQGRFMAAARLMPGDVFRVLAGETLAADGTVTSGEGRVDESALTGEARPVSKKPGDRVCSGTRVISGDFRVRAEAVGGRSLAGQLVSVMEDALAKKTGKEDAADRMLRYFVPAVVILAACTGTAWFVAGLDPGQALIRAVTVLVISCPCALGLAIPLARVAGITLAGEKGILVHDFSAFEDIGRINAAVFDKTGTLTLGRWELVKILPAGEQDPDTLLSIAAGLEAESGHRVAEAIRQVVKKQEIAPARVSGVIAEEGGICGRLGNLPVRIGSAGYLAGQIGENVTGSGNMELTPTPYLSYVYMSVGGRLAVVFCFGDLPRESGAELVRALKARGMKIALVSGDSIRTVRAVGQALGIGTCRGDMDPMQKAGFVRRLRQRGYVTAMVGDGINDAPALAAADIGIAVQSGSNIGKRGSSVTLMGGDPVQVLDFQGLAGRVMRTVRQNLWWTFFYNAAAIPVAMAGLLNPLVAVGAMMLSSLSVTGNTLALIARQERRTGQEE